MSSHETIISCINKNRYIWSEYTINNLNDRRTLKLIYDIIDETGKQPGEAIMLLVCLIRLITKNEDALLYLEQNDQFQNFIEKHYKQILDLSKNRNVQGNLPDRALPIMEILGKKLGGRTVSLLELGPSYGLIGRCLLNSDDVMQNSGRYFDPQQQMPQSPAGINRYLGLEIDIPHLEWIFACLEDSEQRKRLRHFIDDFDEKGNFNIKETSAFGFSALDITNDFISHSDTTVVLTSFMLYQFNRELQDKLKGEIREFTGRYNYNWINQVVDINTENEKEKFYIEWNDNKIIKLENDLCIKWDWI